MSQTTIYGKPGCSRCALARASMPGAEYADHTALHDRYSDALNIIIGSGGMLPIVIVESSAGRLVLRPTDQTTMADCEEGVCKI